MQDTNNNVHSVRRQSSNSTSQLNGLGINTEKIRNTRVYAFI